MKTRNEKTNTVVFTCDRTGKKVDTKEQDFDAAWERAHNLGWTAWVDKKEGGPWQHFCPAASRERAAREAQQIEDGAAQADAPARKKPLVQRLIGG